jgi:hypothetical protein
MKIPMLLTSHDQLGNTDPKTGFWLEEFAAPTFVFRDADVQLTLASPKGGQRPIDPKSGLPENQTPAKQDSAAQKALSQTVRLADVKAEDYDKSILCGWARPMWDLAESTDSIALIESFGVVTSLKEERENSASRIFLNDRHCLAPHVHRRRAKGSVRPCRSEMTLDVESVVGGCVS